jgi:hydrogenase nickel incorporation protein HypB
MSAQLEKNRVVAVNLTGSAGSGKTAVLEATARILGSRATLGVLTRDPITTDEAARMRAAGALAASIETGRSHVDANTIHRRLQHLQWPTLDYLFIESVPPPEYPALPDLDREANVVTMSVAEGGDKPILWPGMFRGAHLVLLTKVDLLPELPEVNLDVIEHNLSFVMPRPAMLLVSAKTGRGINEWIRWLGGRAQPRGASCAVPVAAM